MIDHVRNFWQKQAEQFGTSRDASWKDQFAVDLEIETIGRHIRTGDDVLDAGCANGFSTLSQLDKQPGSLTGIDNCAGMITQAKKRLAERGGPAGVTFQAGDIRALPFEDESFDLVYTTRTLINLLTWEEQKKAVAECLRVCRSSGTLVFSEAFWEPLMLLNAMRSLVSLAPLVEHDFNRYLKKSFLEQYLSSLQLEYRVEDFSSVYYLGSRFLRELVTQPDRYPGYSNPVNHIFYQIEKEYSGGGFGIQQAYVVKKTG